MKLSKHSKMRLIERAGVRGKDKMELFRTALRKGISLNTPGISDTLVEYFKSKRVFGVKIYKGYVFIYSKNNHRLYTMYEVPNYVLEKLSKSEKRRING